MFEYVWFFIYGIFSATASHRGIAFPAPEKYKIYSLPSDIVTNDNRNGHNPDTESSNNFKANIDDKQNERHDSNVKLEKFTDFIQLLIQILMNYDDADLQQAFAILNGEINKYDYRGCKFYELADNEAFKFIVNKINEISYKPAAFIRNYLSEIANRIEEPKYNRQLKELIDFINSLYRQDSVDKINKFLTKLNNYRVKTNQNLNLRKILRDGIKTIIFNHYSKLEYNTRAAIKSKLDHYWKYMTNTDSKSNQIKQDPRRRILATKSELKVEEATSQTHKAFIEVVTMKALIPMRLRNFKMRQYQNRLNAKSRLKAPIKPPAEGKNTKVDSAFLDDIHLAKQFKKEDEIRPHRRQYNNHQSIDNLPTEENMLARLQELEIESKGLKNLVNDSDTFLDSNSKTKPENKEAGMRNEHTISKDITDGNDNAEIMKPSSGNVDITQLDRDNIRNMENNIDENIKHILKDHVANKPHFDNKENQNVFRRTLDIDNSNFDKIHHKSTPSKDNFKEIPTSAKVDQVIFKNNSKAINSPALYMNTTRANLSYENIESNKPSTTLENFRTKYVNEKSFPLKKVPDREDLQKSTNEGEFKYGKHNRLIKDKLRANKDLNNATLKQSSIAKYKVTNRKINIRRRRKLNSTVLQNRRRLNDAKLKTSVKMISSTKSAFSRQPLLNDPADIFIEKEEYNIDWDKFNIHKLLDDLTANVFNITTPLIRRTTSTTPAIPASPARRMYAVPPTMRIAESTKATTANITEETTTNMPTFFNEFDVNESSDLYDEDLFNPKAKKDLHNIPKGIFGRDSDLPLVPGAGDEKLVNSEEVFHINVRSRLNAVKRQNYTRTTANLEALIDNLGPMPEPQKVMEDEIGKVKGLKSGRRNMDVNATFGEDDLFEDPFLSEMEELLATKQTTTSTPFILYI